MQGYQPDEREAESLTAISGGTLVDGKATCKCGGRLYRFSPTGIEGQVSCSECKSVWDEWPPCGRDFTHLLCQKYNCGTHVGRWCDVRYGESKPPEGDAHSMAGLSREDDVWLIRCACGWSGSFSTCSEAGAEMDYHLAGESFYVVEKGKSVTLADMLVDFSAKVKDYLAVRTDMARARAEEVYKAISGRLPPDEPRRSSLDALWELCNQPQARQAPDLKEDIAAACGVPAEWVPDNHADLSEEDLVSAVEEAQERHSTKTPPAGTNTSLLHCHPVGRAEVQIVDDLGLALAGRG